MGRPAWTRSAALGPARYGLVAFDLGGVLFDIAVERFLARASQAFGVAPAAIAAATFGSGAWSRAEVGALDEAGFVDAVLAALGVDPTAATRRAFTEAWCAIPTLRPAVDRLMDRLLVPAAAWSNTDPLHRRCILAETGLEARLCAVATSCDLRVEKPSARFFQAALAQIGLPAHRVAYVDDRADNVAAARALGVDAFVAGTLAGVEAGLAWRALLTR